MTLIELYQRYGEEGKSGDKARALLTQTHWFTKNTDFDPKTGEALPQALSGFLSKITRKENVEIIHDRLWRITEHARSSVERLFRALNESPRREQALLPARAVRELDVSSFIKLCKRPGRNIREKLAGKPYLQAVRRYQSVNLHENSLLKAFVTRLAELLELRHERLYEEEDVLLPRIQSWLLSDEAQSIGRWDNLPPNNTLLSHRNYRRVWDAWCWLQTLDDDIARDFSKLEIRTETMRIWNEYGRLYSDGTDLFAEIPLLFDYEKFEIRPWFSKLAFLKITRKIVRSPDTKKIIEPVCVDLSVLHPCYATTKKSSSSLSETYLWQRWKKDDVSVNIELFKSDAAYLHPDAVSISSKDLFFSKENTIEHLDQATRVFISKLRETFKSDTIIWLVPDFLNDFELEITRRNINAFFHKAEPLPRSVAGVFEQIDYSIIKNEGFSIIVVDNIGGKTCATKLISRYDPELKKRLPETNGFFWERCPPVIISKTGTVNKKGKERQNYDITTLDEKGKWRDRVRTEHHKFIANKNLERDSRIGKFEYCINLKESPVEGGIRLHTLQQYAGNIPLWRDHIPELSIKGKKDGLYQRFFLVGKNTTVRPVRGETVTIDISARFPLPAEKDYYAFPLYQGINEEEIGFSARIDSPAFPLKKETVCKLDLFFEYGADEPYTLIFTPLDKSFPPVRTTWQRTVERIIDDAPAPKYPEPMTWTDLRRVPKPDSNKISDLFEWVLSATDRLLLKRIIGEIVMYWREDKNGNYFTFVECEETDTRVFIHENNIIEGFNYEDFEEGDRVSFQIKEFDDDRFIGLKIARPDYKEETGDLVKSIRKSLYVPFIQIWRDGRSITNEKCPKDFANAAKNRIENLTDLLSRTETPQPVKREILFLLACLHKDTVDDCVQWITEQVENGIILDPKAVGFALGDVSEGWQQYLFSSLASKPNTSALSVFAYAIWRDQHFVENFSISELHATLNVLSQRLENICSKNLKGDEEDISESRYRVRAIEEPLELLLGLLRTRASKNHDIKMILQPHQKITKELARQVERVTEIITKSDVNLFSRVQLDIRKPSGDLTPDLLYALHLYLTGDDGANAIHITSVSDNDD